MEQQQNRPGRIGIKKLLMLCPAFLYLVYGVLVTVLGTAAEHSPYRSLVFTVYLVLFSTTLLVIVIPMIAGAILYAKAAKKKDLPTSKRFRKVFLITNIIACFIYLIVWILIAATLAKNSKIGILHIMPAFIVSAVHIFTIVFFVSETNKMILKLLMHTKE